MADLILKDVVKSYGDVNVLRDINLDIETGELIVFVGPSGCGKSTLLRMIAGLEKITDGTLSIDGQVMNDVPPAQRGIAMVFQTYALYPHMTVRDNMAFALNIAGKSKAKSTRRWRARPKSCNSAPIWTAAQGAFGRAAPARGHRPRHRARPQGLPLRRAAVEPRRGVARGDADRDRAAQGTDARQHDDLRHPRPGGGDDAGQPHRGAGQQGASRRWAARWSCTSGRAIPSWRSSSAARR